MKYRMKFKTNRDLQKKNERLSKLQKWILMTFSEGEGWFTRAMVKEEYYGIYQGPTEGYKKYRNPSREVTLTRSLWTLIERGYLEAKGPGNLGNMAMKYGMKGKSLEQFKKDFPMEDSMSELMSFAIDKAVPLKATRGIVQAKIFRLTEKGKVKAKELLNVNKK